MKAKIMPDWFAPAFAWALTIVVLAIAMKEPAGVYINRSLLWLPPLLAVAWTAAAIGMYRLRASFQNEHEALGSPQLFGSPYERRYWRFISYLLTFRFLRLGDSLISACFSIFIALTAAGLVGVITLIGSFKS
jgi:hypothetical protein